MAGLPALPNTPKIDTFNLKEIGLKIKINKDSDIDDIEVDIDDIIEKWKINEKDLPRNGNFVTIGDKDYEIIGNLSHGAYGEVFKLKHGGIYYALKTQKLQQKLTKKSVANRDDMSEVYSAFYEAITNYILQKMFPDDVSHIYYFTFNNRYFYSLIEFIDGKTIYDSIKEKTTHHDDRMLLLEEPLKSISNILNRIQDPLKFTHGDLHSRNAMVLNSDPTKIKLIDFGFSKLEINNCDIIGNNDFNKKPFKGKDITILLWSLLRNYEDAHLTDPKAKKLLEIYSIILDKYKHYHVNENAKLYTDLDENDNVEAHPTNVLKLLEENTNKAIVPTTTGGGKIGGRRLRMPTASRRATRSRPNSKNTTRKKTMLPSIESLRLEMNPEDIIHTHHTKYSVPVLANVFLQSSIPHIQKYSNKIATLYLNEKNKSLQLDLLKTLLYFDSDVKAGAFEYFCETYTKATMNERIYMIYGTDPSIKGEKFTYIHWNTKKWL